MAMNNPSYSYHTNLTDAGVGPEVYNKLEQVQVADNALTKFTKDYTVGPTNNEYLDSYKFGKAAHDFHYIDYNSTDIVMTRQTQMLAFYIMMNETNKGIETTSREIKNVMLNASKVSL